MVNEWEGKWRPRRGDTLLLLTLRRLVMFHIMSRGILICSGQTDGNLRAWPQMWEHSHFAGPKPDRTQRQGRR